MKAAVEKVYFLFFVLLHCATAQKRECPPPIPPETPRSGNQGDPHILTFDDVRFDCQASGEFITVTSLETPELMVQERFTSIESSFHASVSTGVSIRDEDVPTVEFSTPRGSSTGVLNTVAGCPIDFYVDGTAVDLADADLGPEIEVYQEEALTRINHTATNFAVDITVQNSVSFGCHFIVQVFIPLGYRSEETILGLMGTPNGDRTDDWMAPDGTILPIPATQEGRMFEDAYNYCVNNWINDDASKSLFTYARTDESFESFYGGDEPYDSDIEVAIANPSTELIDICGNDQMCILDGTVGGLEDARAETRARRFVRRPPGGCPDPHLFTWKGSRYDYHGQCDLIYTTCPRFDHNKGLHLHLRTEFVMPLQWSTISSIAIKIGEDVFEVQNNGDYYLNGVVNVDLEDTELAGHTLTFRSKISSDRKKVYTVTLNGSVSLDIKVRDFENSANNLSFQIQGVHDYRMSGGDSFLDCVGLSSTWNHPEDEEEFLVGRDGTLYAAHDAVDFGPEWQVDFTKGDSMLFVDDLSQQLPQQTCADSPLQAKDKRHLKKLHEAEGGALARQAEEACSGLRGDDLFDACVFDVLVTGDASFVEQYNDW